MARRALVEILGDASGYIRSLSKSGAATESFSVDLKKLSVNARASAEAQVAASVKKTSRLRSEAVAYREIAAAAARGSREQIVAANLAVAADGRLARSMGVTAHEANSLRASTSGVERDLGRTSRGALAGSGVFRGLGRSLAFASGGFLAFASAGQFLRTSVDAAETTRKAFRSLGAQVRATGTDVGEASADVGKLAVPGAKLGFNKAELEQGFTVLLRGSGSAKKAMAEMAAAEDVARAKGETLGRGALIVNRALISTGNSARSLGIHFPKAATEAQKLAVILQRFRGQAAANTTETDRFNATLFNSKAIIGDGILPVLNKYLARGAVWLTQMNESGRLQKDVAKGAHDVGEGVHVAADGLKAAASVIHGVDKVTGSLKNTLELLAGAWLLLKGRAVLNWASIAAGEATVGSAAAVATGEVTGLSGALLALRGIGTIAATIAITEFVERKQISKGLYHIPGVEGFIKGVDDRIPFLGNIDKKAGVYPGQLDPNRYGPKTPPGFVPGSYGKRQSTPANPGGYIPKAMAAPRGYQPGTYGQGPSTRDNPGGFLPIGTRNAPGAATQTGRQRPVSLQGQFNLLQLRLADAERTNNTILQRSILVAEEKITMQLRNQAKKLKDRTAFAQQAASLEDQIRSLDSTGVSASKKKRDAAKRAADKAKAAAAKAALGGVSLSLQLAEARADAVAAATTKDGLTKAQIAAREAIRSAENKAIKSHKLSMQGLIDAWNQIAQVNGELASQTGGMAGTYHRVSTHALTAGLGLSRQARVAVEERLAQSAAHRGYIPSSPAAQGQVIHIDTVTITGVRNIDDLASQLEKHAKRKPRRGQR